MRSEPLYNGNGSRERRSSERELDRLRQERKWRRNRTDSHAASFLPGGHIDAVGIWGQRILAVALLAVTFVGTIGVANPGGLDAILATWRSAGLNPALRSINSAALGFAIFVQVVLTITEWYNRHRRSTTTYRAALLIDVVLTFLGWRPVVQEPLAVMLGGILPGLELLAVPLIGYAAFESARLPERIIVK